MESLINLLRFEHFDRNQNPIFLNCYVYFVGNDGTRNKGQSNLYKIIKITKKGLSLQNYLYNVVTTEYNYYSLLEITDDKFTDDF